MDMSKIRTKLLSKSGFSLAEMLMVVMVVLLSTAVIAAGIPAALRAYRNVSDSANAQVLLSTTLTKLKDELGSATDININNSTHKITYTNCFGSQSEIFPSTDAEGNLTVFIKEYAYGEGNLFEVTEDVQKEGYIHPLASSEAANGNFSTTYGLIDYEDGIITVQDIKVVMKDKELATAESFTIHVVADHLKK